MTKADQLSTALDDFLTISTEVEAAAVVTSDGLPMASALPPHVEEDRLAAMSAALLTLGERAASELGKGELAQVFVEGPGGQVILMAAGRDCVLVCVTARGAKVGLVLFEMRRIAERVARVVEDAGAPSFDVLADSPAPVERVGDSALGGAVRPATPVASRL
jgi:predicted regulator of Ras-like GTPase activity (Roadblock/LC7/MglB family)